jgi:hypothetical protein
MSSSKHINKTFSAGSTLAHRCFGLRSRTSRQSIWYRTSPCLMMQLASSCSSTMPKQKPGCRRAATLMLTKTREARLFERPKKNLVYAPALIQSMATRRYSSPRPITKGYGNHADVSLWYVIRGDRSKRLTYDAREMGGYKWYSPAEILAMDISSLDPHMHRFIRKAVA